MVRKTKKVYDWKADPTKEIFNTKFFSLWKKDDEGFDFRLREFLQEIMFHQDFIEGEANCRQTQSKIIERFINLLQEEGTFLIVPGTEALSPMRTSIEKSYMIIDKKTPNRMIDCQQCDKSISDPRSTSQKYCSQRCRLLALYKRQGQKPIEIHTHCIQCGKPLSKRAGAKYCSSACNMAYRRKNIKGSSLPEPSVSP